MTGAGAAPPDYPVACYCGAPCRPRSSRFGRFYACTRPACDGLVGAHKTTGRPLGTPAPAATRALRTAVHAVLDPFWQGYAARSGTAPSRARSRLYGWMARRLERPAYHTGELDAAGCHRVLALLAATEPDAPFRDPPP